MADDRINLSIAEMSRTMGNAVLRERRRCAALVTAFADVQLGINGNTAQHAALTALAEEMLVPPTAQVVPTASVPTVGAPAPGEAEPVDDGLPAVRHGDDIDDGIALARNLMSRGRADFASGGGIGRD